MYLVVVVVVVVVVGGEASVVVRFEKAVIVVVMQARVFALFAEQPISAWDHLCSYWVGFFFKRAGVCDYQSERYAHRHRI